MTTTLRLPPGVRPVFLGEEDKFPALAVETPACTALVAMQGAQLLHMQDARGVPLLWLSPGARYLPGKGVRGGIPPCFPWFGAHPADRSLPAHGFARTRDWQPVAVSRNRDDVHLAFELRDDDATRRLWPHAFLARIDYRLGRELVLDFTVTNTDASAFAFGFALHNYFPVSDVSALRIGGLEDVAFIDTLQAAPRPQQKADAIRIDRETDRVYRDAGGLYRLHDEARGLVRTIAAPADSDAVVWNPWQDKAARLGDMPGDCWRSMVCVETGKVDADAVRLEPGERFTFTQRIALAD